MDITRKKSLIAPLTYLKATIDLGSYTKAAEYLGTTESRLSKEIKAFEKTMKTKLLSRCSRGMTPTHEGMEIYKQAERLDTLFYELENYSLAEHSISGHLKISMTDGIGIYIMPHLVEFHELYPKVCVDVISNHNEVNLKARKADILLCDTAGRLHNKKNLMEELKKFPQIKEVRGRGLMIGLEFEEPVKELRLRLLKEQHVFTGVSGTNVLRLLPPLCLGMDEANLFLERFKKAL